MKLFDRQTATVLATILIFIVVGAFLYSARDVLIAFLFAILFADLLEPWVSWLERRRSVSRGSRSVAILEVYCALGAAVAILVLTFGPGVAQEGRTLASDLPALVAKVSSGQILREISAKHGLSYSTQLQLTGLLQRHSEAILAWIGGLGAGIARSLPNVIWIALIPIVSIFFLKDGRKFSNQFIDAIGDGRKRKLVRGSLDDVNKMLTQFIRTQILLAFLSLVVYMAGFSLLRIPYALILASVAGFLEFIPTVGPLLAALIVIGVAFLAGYAHVFVIVLFLGTWRIVQDYVILPRAMGGQLQLHPLTTIFAVLVGAEVGGIIGVYLSIPVAAGLRIVWKRWQSAAPP